jgi:hypothetical protein
VLASQVSDWAVTGRTRLRDELVHEPFKLDAPYFLAADHATVVEGNCLPSDGASGSVVGMNWRS